MAEPITSTSEKLDIGHLEGAQAGDGYDSYGLVKSRFDELSIPRTLWVFKRVVLVSLAVYTGYVCEGFEVSEHPRPAGIKSSVATVTVVGLYGTARRWRQYCRECGIHQAVRLRGWGRREGT